MDFIWGILILIAGYALVTYVNKKTTNKEPTQEPKQSDTKNTLPYKKKNLFTKSEYKFYFMLRNAAQAENITVFPKVRLEDFIETTSVEEKMKYRGYIRSRHVDFLLCDANKLNIYAAIELDDESHNTKKAKETDNFKNELFNTIGIQLYRINPGSDFAAVATGIIAEIKASKKEAATKQPEL